MIVVTDTSVVLNISWLEMDEVLEKLHSEVWAPEEVRVEFERLAQIDPRFHGLQFPLFIRVARPSLIPEELLQNNRLDRGEQAALALALEKGIIDILMDEAAGRKVARGLGLRPSGLLGLLMAGKQAGLIPEVLPLLDRLRTGARFYMSDELRALMAERTGESI
ncbi:MAG: DUF3368 domain-containing protein [Blastochloris sp.]|nr:DUF3368 domain-containing protein [Blastochloris sp.]